MLRATSKFGFVTGAQEHLVILALGVRMLDLVKPLQVALIASYMSQLILRTLLRLH